MPSRSPSRPPFLPLPLPPRDPGTPAVLWLCTALRAAILEGALRPGTRLPATRDLARQAGLARGTIVAAFEQLKSEGYVTGSAGSGTYVNRVLPDDLLRVAGPRGRSAPSAGPRVVPRATPGKTSSKGPEAGAETASGPGTKPSPAAPPVRRLSAFARRLAPVVGFLPGRARAFRTDQPALDLFPTTLWAQVASRRLRRASQGLLLGCPPAGYGPLREAVADYLGRSRGVRCTPERVLITSGVQEALDLAARVLLDPGDRVCLEDPGYLGAALVFAAYGAEIHVLPAEGEGIAAPGPRLRGVRLAYLTPAHQFPLGTCLELPRRLELLEWADRTGALLFEDDYDSEYRYAGRPLPALQGLDRRGRVLFAGSFSKTLFPALRLGYLVLPADLVDPFSAALSLGPRHAPLLEQAVLADFLAEGHFERHLRRMREAYAERRGVLLESARERLGGLLELTGIEAGLQTAAWLAPGIDAAVAARAAAERQVEVNPLSRYRLHPRPGVDREGLQLGFAAVDPAEIRRGVRELARVLEQLAVTMAPAKRL